MFTANANAANMSIVSAGRAEGSTYDQSTYRFNGELLTATSSVSPTLAPTSTLADFRIGFSGLWTGRILGLMILSSGSQSAIEQAEGFLAHRHGQAALLPSNHPWKNAPPDYNGDGLEPVEPEWFEMQVTTTAPNQTYSWQSGAGTSPNHITEWGDGTTTTHTANGSYTHTYANAGTYTLRIKCAWASNGAFNMRPNPDRLSLTALLGPIPGFPGLINLNVLIANCTGITTLPPDLLRYTVNVTSMSLFIANCTGITTLPPDLLRYTVNVTNLSSFMVGCTGITTLPPDLLRYTVNVTNLSSFMRGCTRAPLRADIFGSNPQSVLTGRAVNFANTFRNVGTLAGTPQGTAPELWTLDYGTFPPTTTNAFASNNSTNLSNWAQIPADWGGLD
jgi:hypothetical protein